MQLTIVYGWYECSHPEHEGHSSVRVLKSDAPWWHTGRAPWAELNWASRRPINRTEGLSWAVTELSDKLHRPSWPADEEDLAEMYG